MSLRQTLLSAAVATVMVAASAFAHGTETHATAKGAGAAPQLPAAVSPLPWDVGGPFRLTDQTGAPRSEKDPDGKFQLLFFGYANCPGICSAALPMMAEAADELTSRGIATRPVLITIDPALDTVATMGAALAKFSPEFVGLTGEPADLDVAYKAFQISFRKIMDDPEYGPIYAHGSHIYLLSPEGKVLTLLPPILPPDQVADIVARYKKG